MTKKDVLKQGYRAICLLLYYNEEGTFYIKGERL